MGNIVAISKYFPIMWHLLITKVQIKAADTVDDNHEPGVIGGYDVTGWM